MFVQKIAEGNVNNEQEISHWLFSHGCNFHWFFLAVAVGWLVPAIFVVVAAVIDRVDIPEIPDEYKPG